MGTFSYFSGARGFVPSAAVIFSAMKTDSLETRAGGAGPCGFSEANRIAPFASTSQHSLLQCVSSDR